MNTANLLDTKYTICEWRFVKQKRVYYNGSFWSEAISFRRKNKYVTKVLIDENIRSVTLT